MKKVLIINTCIGGSTGKIAVGLHHYLSENGIDSIFAYGREDGNVENKYYKIDSKIEIYIHALISRILGLPGYGSYFATKRFSKLIYAYGFDTCYIISPHGYYLNERLFFKTISEFGVKVIYVMVDEYAFLGKCGYSNGCEEYLHGCQKCKQLHDYPKSIVFDNASKIYNMKKKAYQALDKIVFVGPKYTIERAKTSPLLANKSMKLLDEAVNTSFYTPRNTESLKKQLGIKKDQIVLVCVAPYSIERKGCKYFVQLAKEFEDNDKYVFVHVGFNVNNVDVPSNYIKVGFLTDQEKLAQFYSLGDLFVFPSLLDTMPNACLEALSSGTPLLCFNISGMPYIADETVATFVEPMNILEMKKVVEDLKKKDDHIIQRCREYALSRYNNETYFEKLKKIAESI